MLATYVPVTGRDWSRLGPGAEDEAHFVGNRVYMKMRDGHCGALGWRLTADGVPKFFCTVYERRPQLCRDLARGSPLCRGELATKADRVAAWLRNNPATAR
ncbi:conserved hypothetical protein [Opitutus terrae PB90-1]|uniref:Zinc/iron-chelating domain-containing protein n=2 Tax=Opitutus terrae TaxID=107709 RepID=B1ZXN7_OPITP|nr:conserved hypothetical protein [Opitutus terrae PB90-1]